MSLSKRNSRQITVDGESYRWKFSDSYCAETNDHGISVVVQLAAGDGSKLVGSGRCETREYLLEPARIVRPRMVSAIIQFAMSQGWNPKSNGNTFKVENIEIFFAD